MGKIEVDTNTVLVLAVVAVIVYLWYIEKLPIGKTESFDVRTLASPIKNNSNSRVVGRGWAL